jgi:uncharacterized repeat protein (TIGR01451 family)
MLPNRNLTGPGTGITGTPVDMAAAWGQDPESKNTYESGALDLGTTVLPFSTVRASKYVELVNDVDNDGQVSPGDLVKYIVTIMNVGPVDVAAGALIVFDPSLNQMQYVEGSSTYDTGGTIIPVSDSFNGTPFPLDDEGLPIMAVLPKRGGVHEISMHAIVDSGLPTGECPVTEINSRVTLKTA